jgi:signal transduction histidine kinase
MPRLGRLAHLVREPDPRLVDAAVAAVLTGWVVAELPGLSEHTRPVPLFAMAAATAFRRRRPLTVLAIVLVGVAFNADGDGGPAEIATVVVASYSAAVFSSRRWLAGALVVATAVVAAAIGGGLPVPDRAVPFLVLVPVWLAGTALRRRARRAEEWEDRATRLEREQTAALRAERARIARELHDVVTHGVSVMVLQTGAARQVLASDPPRAEALLRSVEAGGRDAMNELRNLLGLLGDEGSDAPRAPQPGLAQIEQLIDRVRDAGLPVELTLGGDARPLPSGIDLAAYRIVQEALTNALRHGKTGPAHVGIRYSETALELEILDQSRAVAPDGRSDERGGRGLVGMRERIALYGGTLQARPEPGRGYAVRARLPLDPLRP